LKTGAKRLLTRSLIYGRRARLVEEVTLAGQRAGWRSVIAAAEEVGDPQAMELAQIIEALIGQLTERALELRDDAAEVPA
jgi:hypothetical protein